MSSANVLNRHGGRTNAQTTTANSSASPYVTAPLVRKATANG